MKNDSDLSTILENPGAFHNWYREENSKRSSDELLTMIISETSDVSLIRQLNVVIWSSRRDRYEKIRDQAFQSKNLLVEAYAVAVDSYLDITGSLRTKGDPTQTATSYLAMLQNYQTRLTLTEQTPLCREVQTMVHVTTGLAFFFLQKFDDCAQEASQAIFWAKKYDAIYMLSAANSLLLATYSNSGQNERALEFIRLLKENHQDQGNIVYQNKAYAELLFYLGHTHESINLLEKCLQDFSPKPILGVHSALLRSQLLLGIGGLDTENDDADQTHSWIVDSTKCLVKYQGLPRTSQTLNERITLLQKCSDIWQKHRNLKLDWGTHIGIWIATTSFLWQRHFSNAKSTIDLVNEKIYETEWLDLRILLIGAKLELALKSQKNEFDIHLLEKQLTNIFMTARALEFGSSEGLAERLLYWHPLAAAYGALMPNGIEDLQEATRALLRIGKRNICYGETIPPAYAAELALRSLGFDEWPNFSQAEIGKGRLKRNVLQGKWGNTTYVKPALSIVPIVYGLVKSGHLDQAKSVYIEYGVTPHTKSEYAMLPLLDRIDELLRSLVTGKCSIEMFEASFIDLD
ncbi:MAG: hypothetical protein ACRCYY_03635 [Trueperaceae bacterium]